MCCPTSAQEENVCHYNPLQTWFSSNLPALLLNKYVHKIVCVLLQKTIIYTMSKAVQTPVYSSGCIS